MYNIIYVFRLKTHWNEFLKKKYTEDNLWAVKRNIMPDFVRHRHKKVEEK